MIGGENCVLLEVRRAGTPDAYGDVDSAGDPTWQGRAPGFLRRKRRLRMSGGLATTIEQDELIVRLQEGVQRVVAPGDRTVADTVIIDDLRGLEPVRRTFRVAGVTVRSALGTPADSILLELSDGD